MTLGPETRQRSHIGVAAILVALVAAAVFGAIAARQWVGEVRLQRAIDGAFSSEIEERSEALAYLAEPEDPGEMVGPKDAAAPRLLSRTTDREFEAFAERLAAADDQIIFEFDAAFASVPAPAWFAPTHPSAAGRLTLARLERTALLTAPPETLAESLRAWSMAADANAASAYLRWLIDPYNIESANLAIGAMFASLHLEPPAPDRVVAAALGHPSHEAARAAWLLMAALDPAGGYTARWEQAPDDVAEAMLFSAAWTNPNSARLIERIRSDEAQRARFGADLLDWLEAVAARADRASLPPAEGQAARRLKADARRAIERVDR